MFVVYVLKSKRNEKRYVGYTSKAAEERLLQHNAGSNKWTRVNRPFVIVHKECFNLKVEAIKREHFLKSGQGRKYLDSILRTY
ncbi:MAG TPA: GIY-YIG nuclease family protein [Candidatus Paceibacterota bacterium]